MKVKMKFDAAGVKTWLFEHGEKAAFGLMVVVFLMFIYSAVKREVLEAAKQPERLQQAASEVTKHITDSKWDDKSAGVQLVDYQRRAQRDKVPFEAFAINVPLTHPVFDPKGKRDDPEILNAEEIRVGAGVGTFAIKNEAVAGNPNAPPRAGQSAAGAVAARDNRGIRPNADSNLRAQAWAVVTGLVPIEKQAKEYTQVFSRALGEVPERDVPHYARPKFERAEVDPANPDKLEWKEVPSSEAFEALWDVPGEEIVAATLIDENFTSRAGPLVDSRWDPSAAHPKIRLAWEIPSAPDIVVSYKLMRFFDYTVEPNHRYRYRFRLAVRNPNYRVDRKFLKKPDAPSNNQEVRLAEKWSDPTDVVTIPSGYGVLAGTVEPKSAEPIANLLLTGISPKDGIPAAAKAKVYRGSVANKKEPKVKATDPRSNKTTVIEEMDFKTNMVVLDIFGGKTVSLSKRRDSPITAPGEVLLVDAHGNLIVHNDLDDLAQYELRKPPEDSEPARPERDKIPDEAKPKKAPRNPRPPKN
jgi:hypothetical protein